MRGAFCATLPITRATPSKVIDYLFEFSRIRIASARCETKHLARSCQGSSHREVAEFTPKFCGVHHPCRCVGVSVGQISEAPIPISAARKDSVRCAGCDAPQHKSWHGLGACERCRTPMPPNSWHSLLSGALFILHIHAFLTYSTQNTGLECAFPRTVMSGRLDFLLL